MKKEKKARFSLQLVCVLSVFAMILLTEAVSSVLSGVITKYLGITIRATTYYWTAVFSIVIGIGAAIIVSIIVFRPIKVLGKAMQRVKDGHFDTKLSTNTRLSEIKEVYENFNTMTQELSSIDTLQNDFITNVSHEFKTPINAIEGYTTLLQTEDMSEDEKQMYIERIMYNTNRLSKLVGNILLISKIDNQSIDTNISKFRLDEQIRQAIISLDNQISAKNISLEANLDNISINSDEDILQHVWINLIDNAIKFTPDNGIISITLHNSDGKTVFCIDDSGPGVSDEDKKVIFNRFYQADLSHKSEGNGLGLSLVQKIIDYEKGSVEVCDSPLGGAEFKVKLNNL